MTTTTPSATIQLRRTYDGRRLTAIAHAPGVREWLGGGETALPVEAIVSDPKNVCLESDDGGFICVRQEDGVYEVHTILQRASKRVKQAAAYATELLRYMFLHTDCTRLLTRVPDDNDRALALAQGQGFRAWFHRPACWLGHDGTRVGVSVLSLDVDHWLFTDTTANAAAGAVFHLALARAWPENQPHDEHPDDRVHDTVVGAAVQMVRAGNLWKGVDVYNRWAQVAGYHPVAVASSQPPILDIGTALVAITATAVEVIACRSGHQSRSE